MFRVETWICTTLFSIGIIFGITYLNLSGYTLTGMSVGNGNASASVEDDANLETVKTDLTDNAFDPPAVSEFSNAKLDDEFSKPRVSVADAVQDEALERADNYLAAGSYALALENYGYFGRHANGGSSILLREAFCCEMQERFDFAEDKYYRALTSAASDSHRLLGVAGLARCLVRKGNLADALDMLAEQNLKIDQYVGVSDEIRSQVVYQYAKILEIYAVHEQDDLTKPMTVAFENVLPKPESIIGAIDDPGKVVPSIASTTELRLEILQRPSNSLNVITASISAKLEPVSLLIGHIAAEADQSLLMSQRASSAIENRAKTIELQSVQLSSVLDQLLLPLELVWFQVDSELHIAEKSEVDINVAPRQYYFDAAHRGYRRMELTFDDTYRRHASMLSRANMSFIQNRLDAALNQFQELAQTEPTGDVLAKLFFNQAKLNILLDRIEQANRLLYLAVDQSQDPDLQSCGYCLLGENLLSGGDLESSIKTSGRGLAIAVTQSQKLMASLNLARAYLLRDEPYMANKLLFDNREHYIDSESKSIASILGAYARFIGVRDDNGKRIARNRLLSAVTMVPEDNYQSFVDAYVAGLALERLGFREDSVKKLMLALTLPGVGVWKRKILFEMGVQQHRLERFSEATASFESVIQNEDDSWNRLAMENLAKIYLVSNQPEKSIETCKRLWDLPLEDARKKSVLEILGNAFEKKGEHYTAALCFAGMVPEQF